MREYTVPALFLFLLPSALAQTAPAGWTVVKDSKAICQLTVPPNWVPLPETNGAAIYHDPSTAIAVVTSQPGQVFKPMPAFTVKVLGIGKDKIYENTAKRIFYQDKTSQNAEDPNAYTASVPGKTGTCSCRVVVLPSVADEVARQIVNSLGPVPEQQSGGRPAERTQSGESDRQVARAPGSRL